MACVLLVEDDRIIRDIVGEALTEAGHEVTVAENGVEAMSALRARTFDAVVSDFMMPAGVSGIDLASYLESTAVPTKVILVSGLSRNHLGTLPDQVAFLAKPYRVAELVSLLPQ